jgi:hypothetical protein
MVDNTGGNVMQPPIDTVAADVAARARMPEGYALFWVCETFIGGTRSTWQMIEWRYCQHGPVFDLLRYADNRSGRYVVVYFPHGTLPLVVANITLNNNKSVAQIDLTLWTVTGALRVCIENAVRAWGSEGPASVSEFVVDNSAR